MSKAVLVLDMPPCCYACQFCDEDDACLAMSTSTIDVEDILREKPEWCPLVPMPEKVKAGEFIERAKEEGCFDGCDDEIAYFEGRELGWNDALRAIEGEEENPHS